MEYGMVRNIRKFGYLSVMGILTTLLTSCANEAPTALDRRQTTGSDSQTISQTQAAPAAPVQPVATTSTPATPNPVVVAPVPPPIPAPTATPEQNAELTRLVKEKEVLENKMQELVQKQAMLNQQMQVEQQAMASTGRPAMNNNAAQNMARRLAQGLLDIAQDFQRVVQAVQAGDIAGVIQGLQDLLTGVQTEIEKIQDQLAALDQLIDQINDLIQGNQQT
jgi:hypothetical protein